MIIHPKLQPILYSLGVFVIFTTVMIILKLLTHRTSYTNEYFGLFTNNDLLMGAAIAIILTFSHERKKKLNK